MADIVPDQIAEVMDVTRDLVSEKFNQSRDYASQAWSDTSQFLDDLANLVVSAVMPTTDIDYDYQTLNLGPDLTAVRPDTPTDEETTLADLVLPTEPSDDVGPAIMAKLLLDLANGGTGLSAEVEGALWDRAKARKEVINEKTYEEAEEYFSSRGWTMPPGALNASVARARAEMAREELDMSTDIMNAQAKLAVENTHFIMTSAISYEDLQCKVYSVSVEAFKTALLKETTRVDNIIRVFLARVDEYKADSSVRIAEIDEAIKVFEARIAQAKNQTELQLKEAELSLQNAVHYYGLQIEAAKAGASVSAQITASALSSVNASAQIGYHGQSTETMSYDYNYDQTKGVATTAFTYDHNYDETAAE